LALTLIVAYASGNNLPFSWSTGSGEFNASDKKYSSPDEFLLALKKHSGAPDFANSKNTTQIGMEHIQPGSLNVLTAVGNSQPNHIQVIDNVIYNGKQVAGYKAGQGNFNNLGRVMGSNDPTSARYLGVHVQFGTYDVYSNTWSSPQTGVTTNFIGVHYVNQYRDFNFMR
jgi:hypothetical protein